MCASESQPERQPSFEAFRSNWKNYDAPFATKVRLVLANNWKKARTRQNCCGNHGQPGC